MSSEKEELQRQIVAYVSELDGLKNTLAKMSNDQAEKSMRNEKLSRENQLLLARTKQLEIGIDQHTQLKDNQTHSDEANDEYAVEKIVGHKKIKGVWHYKIRWEGYGPKDDTWEKEANLYCSGILNAYKKSIEEK